MVKSMETSQTLLISRSRWVSITATMTALALVGNYVLVAIPNVELGSAILFVTGYVFGFEMAAWCVLLVSIIFGAINPWGGFVPQIWITQLVGWLFIAVSGAILGNQPNKRDVVTDYRLLGMLGAFLTLFFDLITNLGWAWAGGLPYWTVVLSGIPFMIIHIASNTVIFAAVPPQLSKIVLTHFREAIWTPRDNLELGREE
ncbi:MAG: hypothetical protein ACFE7R_02260 [Candidatus Hodarchaeota archaeon]